MKAKKELTHPLTNVLWHGVMTRLAALTRTCQLAVHRLAELEPGKDMFEREDASSKPVTRFVAMERRCTRRANAHAKEAAFASKRGLKSEFLQSGQR